MNFKEYRENEGKKYVPIAITAFVLFVICILFFFVVFRFSAVRTGISTIIKILMPFFYGAVFAYLLRPMCKYFDRNFSVRLQKHMKDQDKAHKISNVISVFLSIFLVVAVVFGIVTLTLQSVINSIVGLINSLPTEIAELTAWLEMLFAGNEVAVNYIHNFTDTVMVGLDSVLSDHLVPNLQNLIGGVSAGAMSVISQFINLFVGLIAAIYLLLSRNRWRAQLKLVLSSIFKGRTYTELVKELYFVDRTFTDYISGRILDSVILGVITYVGCLVMGLQDAALIALLNGITNIIPYFGPYIGAIPSVILIFMDEPIKCIWFIIFILVLQQVDGNIICPKILSDKVGLSSFWVLFSTLLFGGLFGFVGLLVGVPVFVVIYDLIKKFIYHNLRKRGKEDMIEEYEATYHPPEKPKKNHLQLHSKVESNGEED